MLYTESSKYLRLKSNRDNRANSVRRKLRNYFLSPSFMADQQLQCRDCGQSFTFTDGEQEFYASKQLSAPQRCKDCRNKRKNERMQDRQMFDATCAKCGASCQVPFKPRPVEEGGRPVLCKACFDAQRMAA